VLLWLATGQVAGALPVPAPLAIEVVSPAPGQPLRAGGTVEVAWRLRDGVEADIVEWEALLSLDDGWDHWLQRLTPQLGPEQTRVEIDLPPVATRHARLLLRFGDEHGEVELEVPFELVLEPEVHLDAAQRWPSAPAFSDATPPGGAGVTLSKDGSFGSGRVSLCQASHDHNHGQWSRARVESFSFAGMDDARWPELGRRLCATAEIRQVESDGASDLTASVPRALPVRLRLALLSRRNE
jgi:hypothetical protein